MSRGGRGGGRGGFGAAKGPGDGLNMAGMTYAEISAASKGESTALYPDFPAPFPVLPGPSLEEEAAVRTQVRFGWTMALNTAFLREAKKGDDIERYTDKYKTADQKPPTLNAADYAPKELQPTALYEAYYSGGASAAGKKKAAGKKVRKKANLDAILSGEEGSGDEAGDSEGDLGSQEEDDDYDADEGDDDYGDNYFDNGEDDDGGDDGGGGGGDDGGTFD